jgi:hypothetical protein
MQDLKNGIPSKMTKTRIGGLILLQQWEDNMRVLGTLIKRELFEHLTSSRYVVTSILCAVLCVTSIVLMSHDYANRRKRFDLSHNVSGLREMPKDRLLIAKPPQPLSIIAKGTVLHKTSDFVLW